MDGWHRDMQVFRKATSRLTVICFIYFLNPLFFLRLDFYFNTNVGLHTLIRSNDVMLNAVAYGTKRLRSSRDVDIYLVLFHVEGPRPEWYWELRGQEALAFLLLHLLISTYIFGTKYCVERSRPLAKDLCVGLFFCSEVNHPCVREQSKGRSNFVLEILKLRMIRQYTSLIFVIL